MNWNELIKEERIIEVGYNYLTDDDRILLRVYTGRSATPKWQVAGSPEIYRSLGDAYSESYGKIYRESNYYYAEPISEYVH